MEAARHRLQEVIA